MHFRTQRLKFDQALLKIEEAVCFFLYLDRYTTRNSADQLACCTAWVQARCGASIHFFHSHPDCWRGLLRNQLHVICPVPNQGAGTRSSACAACSDHYPGASIHPPLLPLTHRTVSGHPSPCSMHAMSASTRVVCLWASLLDGSSLSAQD